MTAPAPKFMLGGVDNRHLYHNSTLALDVDTGEIRWHYQHLNDHWDLAPAHNDYAGDRGRGLRPGEPEARVRGARATND